MTSSHHNGAGFYMRGFHCIENPSSCHALSRFHHHALILLFKHTNAFFKLSISTARSTSFADIQAEIFDVYDDISLFQVAFVPALVQGQNSAGVIPLGVEDADGAVVRARGATATTATAATTTTAASTSPGGGSRGLATSSSSSSRLSSRSPGCRPPAGRCSTKPSAACLCAEPRPSPRASRISRQSSATLRHRSGCS